MEQQLDSGDPKAALAAAKYILQGTRLLGDTDLSLTGPTTPEKVILEKLKREAWQEVEAKLNPKDRILNFPENDVKAETLAQSRLKKAMAEEGLLGEDRRGQKRSTRPKCA